jgi:signal transduction histidine kinase
MSDLRPAALNLGLFAAIDWQLKQFVRTSGIDCKLVATEEAELGLDENKILAVFRIFQESLSNVVRHAQATKVEVTLCRDERGFSMTIKDNGKGIEPGDRKKANSFGLMGIKERAHALEAEFAIESSPENGTALSIFIAMEKNSTNEQQISLRWKKTAQTNDKSFDLSLTPDTTTL